MKYTSKGGRLDLNSTFSPSCDTSLWGRLNLPKCNPSIEPINVKCSNARRDELQEEPVLQFLQSPLCWIHCVLPSVCWGQTDRRLWSVQRWMTDVWYTAGNNGPAWPLLDWAALMFDAELATGTVFSWGREAATRCVILSGIGRRTLTEISVNTSLTSLCWSFFSFLMYSLLLHPLGQWHRCCWMCSRFLPAVCLSNVACSISLRSSVGLHVCFLCRPVGLNRLMIVASPRSCSATSDTC